jgi:hypothetical protein
MFRALLAHPQEALHKRHLLYCVRMSVGPNRVPCSHWQPFLLSRPTSKLIQLGITHNVIQIMDLALSLGTKRSGLTADQYSIAGSEIKNACSYVSSRSYIL